MVRKMLKAFIRVTADKTHLAIDIKNHTMYVYHFALQSTWVQQYKLRNFFFTQFTSIIPILNNVPPYNSLTFAPLQFINQMTCFTSHQLTRLPLLLFNKHYHSTIIWQTSPFRNYCLSTTMCSPITDFTKSECHNNFTQHK